MVYTDTNLASVVAAIVEIGGSYSDVVQLLHEAKKTGALEVRVAVDALPKADVSFTERKMELPRKNLTIRKTVTTR